ncbi:MAG: twin-arginine translocation signal domain-containing protein [Pseudomonadota bacterium]
MSDTEKTSRRDLLKLGLAAAPAAAVTVVTGGKAEAAVEEAGEGYRKTAHVKAYLDSTRF